MPTHFVPTQVVLPPQDGREDGGCLQQTNQSLSRPLQTVPKSYPLSSSWGLTGTLVPAIIVWAPPRRETDRSDAGPPVAAMGLVILLECAGKSLCRSASSPYARTDHSTERPGHLGCTPRGHEVTRDRVHRRGFQEKLARLPRCTRAITAHLTTCIKQRV